MKKFLFIVLALICISPSFMDAAPDSKADAAPEPKAEKHSAFFNKLTDTNKGFAVEADYIEWYFGEQANIEAEIDNDCLMEDDKCIAPDGYYIRNTDQKSLTLPIAKDATVIMQTYQIEKTNEIQWDQEVTLEEFIKEFESSERLQYVPYHIEVQDGAITKITEQYVP
ncbi:hypothetical protein D0469_05025 [Peribacillus saganii]|uniref:Uncharacterized protein n=1 Tax=Peribacillus saganii TaxID=2303992 RepID=A0A372LRG4_9BACI|nr:hypothetical protein [Peribacillus saganii]RFU70809.1 hypothetical protein D0469_05025 [Peribacillus saganii]